MMALRLSVRENRLFVPSQLTAEDCRCYVARGTRKAPSLAFPPPRSTPDGIWALFVRPGHEGGGIGRALFAAACDALFGAGSRTLRLSTDPDTRAERFYRAAGWREAGRAPEGELIFEFSVPPA
jgi:GNAT superfamily N-acetyltransferase